jgi:protein-arginine kinase activator protein McsA
MEAAGVILDDDPSKPTIAKKEGSRKKPVTALSIAELNKKLDEVLNREDYESAAKIRDEINKRKESEG